MPFSVTVRFPFFYTRSSFAVFEKKAFLVQCRSGIVGIFLRLTKVAVVLIYRINTSLNRVCI